MTARIALFRARKDAAGSAARLRRLGFSVAHLPVIEIAPLPFATAKRRYDAVVATSAKAFLSEAPVDRASPLFVVGARTAREGEARGWRLAAPPAPDAERLIRDGRAVDQARRERALSRRPRSEARRSRRRSARRARSRLSRPMRRKRGQGWRPAEARALASCAFALHYSRRSAALAVRLAKAAGLSGRFAAMTHVCLSADVAGPLEAIGAAHVLVAERPDEPALLAALSHAARLFPSDRPYRI